MIAVVDYGAGNLSSVSKALDFLGCRHIVTDSPAAIEAADAVILPGVGAFPAAMAELEKKGLTEALTGAAAKKPFLGICLGMQLLFEKSFEFGETNGLSLIPGEVRKIEPHGLKLPHMGWNSLALKTPCAITEKVKNGDYVYFVHSYAAVTPPEFVAAVTDYGDDVTAAVCRGNVFGTQFHPEKSGGVGLTILRSFINLSEEKTS